MVIDNLMQIVEELQLHSLSYFKTDLAVTTHVTSTLKDDLLAQIFIDLADLNNTNA